MRSERRSSNSSRIHEWLSVQQVAEHLQVSRVTVWRWLRAGRLSGIRVGRIRRIPLTSLQQFIRPEREKGPAVSPKRRALGTIFTLTHPLWELVGKGRGGGANVSGNKYKFLANAIRRR
jgi:excisionase family DNA binding protein